jgi:hypothetical protein
VRPPEEPQPPAETCAALGPGNHEGRKAADMALVTPSPENTQTVPSARAGVFLTGLSGSGRLQGDSIAWRETVPASAAANARIGGGAGLVAPITSRGAVRITDGMSTVFKREKSEK